jgi:hypothetical protein
MSELHNMLPNSTNTIISGAGGGKQFHESSLLCFVKLSELILNSSQKKKKKKLFSVSSAGASTLKAKSRFMIAKLIVRDTYQSS